MTKGSIVKCTMFECHCGKCSPVILAKEEGVRFSDIAKGYIEKIEESYDFPIELGEFDNEMFTMDELLGDEDE